MASGLAARAEAWLEELGAISDESPQLTRTFLSPALGQAKLLVAHWMHDVGMQVFEDAAGNLIGHYDCGNPEASTMVCGSHLDTVRNAGKYDGAMGVVAGVMAVSEIARRGGRPACHIDVVAFSDEEGVRFQTTYLGSRHYTGRLGAQERAARDLAGVSVAEAMAGFRPAFAEPVPPRRLAGYVEAHIEQGPVLEEVGLALGVVTAIAGQTRARVFLEGMAGHAGTTPMKLRKDALAGAAECILLLEEKARALPGLVATVGEIHVESAASNVIPGRVNFTVDIRDANNRTRLGFCRSVFAEIEARMARRGLRVRIEAPLVAPSTKCSAAMTQSLASIVARKQKKCPKLVSGAGHDAVALAEVVEVAMLFVRCRRGLSHHPDEYAAPEDVALAVEVLADFLMGVK